MAGRTLSCGCHINPYGIREHYCNEHRNQAEEIWQQKTFFQRLPSYLGIFFVTLVFLAVIAGFLFFLGAILYSVYLNW
jgi:hypothetical protein